MERGKKINFMWTRNERLVSPFCLTPYSLPHLFGPESTTLEHLFPVTTLMGYWNVLFIHFLLLVFLSDGKEKLFKKHPQTWKDSVPVHSILPEVKKLFPNLTYFGKYIFERRQIAVFKTRLHDLSVSFSIFHKVLL